MKLERIQIANFKSINAIDIGSLGPINVFFGPTNSGKTSILESIYFQVHHQTIGDPRDYQEFLHSKANPNTAIVDIHTYWSIEEPVLALNLRPGDRLECVTKGEFHAARPNFLDEIILNGVREENPDRERALLRHIRESLKLSSSRRPGDSKRAYFSGGGESSSERRNRFGISLRELSLQGENYNEFLTSLQRMFPHLVYSTDSQQSIIEFFGDGFLGTAKLFIYLFDARYTQVLIDEPEIHLYPSLTHKFVGVLHEVTQTMKKQIFLSTHSTLFLQERNLGDFYHIAKSKHYITQVRKVDQTTLLQGLDILNATPESILQSDILLYVEGPTDIGIFEEFCMKFVELDHVNISVMSLGGGSMGNINIDPAKLKMHNPLSFIVIDSERKSHAGTAEPSHEDFQRRRFNSHVYCLMLERQAIENYLSPRALRLLFRDRVPSGFHNDPYLPLDKQGLPWYEKSMNRSVAHMMTREEVEEHPDLRELFYELIRVSKQLE